MTYTVYGLFVPKTFRSQYALDDSFPGRFVPWTFRSLDVSFSGLFVPWGLRNNMDTIVFVSVIRRIYEVNLKTKLLRLHDIGFVMKPAYQVIIGLTVC